MTQAADTFVRAFDYYVDAGDSDRAVSVALADIRAATVREMIERALTLVPPDSHDAGKLQARQILANRADYDKAQGAFQRAFSIARKHQDQSLEMQALVASACVDFHHGHNEQSLERNLRVIELSHLVDMPYEETHAHYDLFHVLYAMGDSDQAASHAETMVASAERTRIRMWRSRAMEANEALGSAKGDWQTAREFTEQGLAISPQESTLMGARALVGYQLGETEAGDAYLNILFENYQAGAFDSGFQANHTVPAVVIPMVSYITGIEARFEFVEDIARSVFSSPDANPSATNAAHIGLALIAAQRGDETAAKELYGALQPIAGTMAPTCSYGPGLAVDRIRGLLSQTMGNLDQAADNFEHAAAFCRKAGYRPELGWTCCDYADALSLRNGPGDHKKAAGLLDESMAIATELGMRPLMERVADRQGALATQPVAKATYPDGLTQREVEVLRLLAQGKSNSQIAQELVVAEGTSLRHVANIHEKIDVANRAEATRYALREGLLSLDESSD